MRLDLVFLVGRTASGCVIWGVCDLIMILGSLSANGWGCVPVLLVVWHRVSSTVACWCWVELGLSVEMEISGRAFAIWYYMELGGLWWTNVLNSALPPQSHRPDTLYTPPRPCQPHSQVRGEFLAFWEVWGLLPAFSRCSVGFVPHVDVFLMYMWGGRWSPRLTPPPSWRSPMSLF